MRQTYANEGKFLGLAGKFRGGFSPTTGSQHRESNATSVDQVTELLAATDLRLTAESLATLEPAQPAAEYAEHPCF